MLMVAARVMQAAGAGVAEVMAYLNGCMLPHVSRRRSLPLPCRASCNDPSQPRAACQRALPRSVT